MARERIGRAESIARLQSASIRKVKAALKTRGISVLDIDGPAEDDDALRNLQEWQAIERALDSENSAQAEKSTSVTDFSSPAVIDSAAPSEASKSGKKGV